MAEGEPGEHFCHGPSLRYLARHREPRLRLSLAGEVW